MNKLQHPRPRNSPIRSLWQKMQAENKSLKSETSQNSSSTIKSIADQVDLELFQKTRQSAQNPFFTNIKCNEPEKYIDVESLLDQFD